MSPLIHRKRDNQHTAHEDLSDFEVQPEPTNLTMSWCYICATYYYNEKAEYCSKCGNVTFRYLNTRDITKPLQKSQLHKNVTLGL